MFAELQKHYFFSNFLREFIMPAWRKPLRATKGSPLSFPSKLQNKPLKVHGEPTLKDLGGTHLKFQERSIQGEILPELLEQSTIIFGRISFGVPVESLLDTSEEH